MNSISKMQTKEAILRIVKQALKKIVRNDIQDKFVPKLPLNKRRCQDLKISCLVVENSRNFLNIRTKILSYKFCTKRNPHVHEILTDSTALPRMP